MDDDLVHQPSHGRRRGSREVFGLIIPPPPPAQQLQPSSSLPHNKSSILPILHHDSYSKSAAGQIIVMPEKKRKNDTIFFCAGCLILVIVGISCTVWFLLAESSVKGVFQNSNNDPSAAGGSTITTSPTTTTTITTTISPTSSTIRKSPTTTNPTSSPAIWTDSPSKPKTHRPSFSPFTQYPTTSFPSFHPTAPTTTKPTSSNPSKTPTFRPTTQQPTTKTPTTRPTTAQPTTKNPTFIPTITFQPTTKIPTTTQPTTKTPTTLQPTTKPPTTLQPTTNKPSTKTPTLKLINNPQDTTTVIPTSPKPSKSPTKRPTKPTKPTKQLPTAKTTTSPTMRIHPHIVISLADDLGNFDVGFHGNTRAYTPVLDSLVKSSATLKLTRHYSSRFCSPSRAMLMTGRVPWSLGLETDQNSEPVAVMRCGLRPDRHGMFLSEKLQQDGKYTTHALGKWHLGHYDVALTPLNRGFDTFVGRFAGGNTISPQQFMTTACACNGAGVGCAVFSTKEISCVNALTLVNVTRNEKDGYLEFKRIPPNVYESMDHLLAQEADRIITSHARTRDPRSLFLYLAWTSPHTPTTVTARFRSLVMTDTDMANDNCITGLRRTHLGMVAQLDEVNGQVLDSLQRNDLYKDTIFIFTSDNGGNSPREGLNDCATFYGKDADQYGFNFPFRGQKYSWWEGGTRTATFIHSPWAFLSTTTITQQPTTKTFDNIPQLNKPLEYPYLFSLTDWWNTLIEASSLVVHAENKPDQGRDSISQWQRLKSYHKAALELALTSDNSNNVVSSLDTSLPPRLNIVMQYWELTGRSVVLLHDYSGTNKIYKQIRGQPFSNGGPGYNPNTLGYTRSQIWLPPELPKTEIPSGLTVLMQDIATNQFVSGYLSYFDLTSDVQEINPIKPPTYIQNEFVRILSLASQIAIPYVKSKLCDDGYLSSQTLTVTDDLSLSAATKCSGTITSFVGLYRCIKDNIGDIGTGGPIDTEGELLDNSLLSASSVLLRDGNEEIPAFRFGLE
jgi:arylsulfatase A-like enzyme